MTFLINASNLKNGGGLQVAQSICGQVGRFKDFTFILVLSSSINDNQIEYTENVLVYRYNISHSLKTIILGRDAFLDDLVANMRVDAVLTVFGPSLWRPRVPHLCGFARAQLLLSDSPYYRRLSIRERFTFKLWAWAFRRSSNYFFTESVFISDKLLQLIKGAKVYTVTNYYNQVFDHPELWQKKIQLPLFEGTTVLTISSTAAHKNLGIMVPMAEYLESVHPDFKFRFVLTCSMPPFQLPNQLKSHFVFIGKVDVSECPNLYEQANIMFMPTLMECFTATYPEAMRMQVPIVTTDLDFARGLCGEAAYYYSAVDAKSAAESIYEVATNETIRSLLTANGKEQLKKYDNYEQRANKLMAILVEIATK